MAHNPILDRKNLTLLSKSSIPPGAVGLIYSNGKLVKRLAPGEQTGLGDWGGILSIIDQRPHRMVWEIKLPTSNSNIVFPVRIDMEYQVDDVIQIV